MANELTRYIDDQYIESGVYTSRTSCAVGHWLGDPTKGALRFTDIVIGQGATFNFAKIYFKYNSVGDAGTWKWRLYGMDEDNTADFSSYPMGRTKTTAYNQYDEGEPTGGGAKELDCINIANEIVARGGWSSGNAMGFLLEHDSSDTNVYAFVDLTNSYFAYRLAAEPNFKPTPKSVNAPSLPSAEDYGIKISKPGQSVLTATETQLYFTSRRKQFKVVTEAQEVLTSVATKTIAHGLGYTPMVEVFAKASGGDWKRVPWFGSNNAYAPYYYVNSTNLVVNLPANGYTIYYYIFLDELDS